MGKFCKVYKVPCACVTCFGVECAQSPKTRGEAEILRGVKLSRDGEVLEDILGLGSNPGLPERVVPPPPPPEARPTPPPIAVVPPPPAAKPIAVSDSLLLHKIDKPSRKRRVWAGSVIVVGAVLCAAILMLGTFYVIEKFRAKPEPVVEEVAVVTPAKVEELAKVETSPAPDASQPIETVSLEQVIAGLNKPSPGITELPPPSPKEQLDAQVKQYKDEGNEAVKQGNFEAARVSYQAAVEADPMFYQGWNNLANTYNDEGNHVEAEPIYKRGLAIEPESASLRFNLGNSHYRAGRFEQALAEFNYVISQNPNDIDAHLLAGISHYRLGQFADAAKHFQTVTVINPESADGYYNMALALRKQGQDALAKVYYRDALRINPELVRAFAKN